jgi:uncharacterized protein
MTVLQHIAVDSVPPQPWRNGGGSTRELFTWPGGTAPWQLRISVADITQDGPFSAFDGVDRWFAVLQGDGVRLGLPGDAPQTLNCSSPPLQFDGGAAPDCWLTGGATRDLNLMLHRSAGRALLQTAEPGQPWAHCAPLRGLFTTCALQLQVDGQAAQAVAAWSLLLGTAPAQQRWQINPDGAALPAGARALWLAFTPQPHHP